MFSYGGVYFISLEQNSLQYFKRIGTGLATYLVVAAKSAKTIFEELFVGAFDNGANKSS